MKNSGFLKTAGFVLGASCLLCWVPVFSAAGEVKSTGPVYHGSSDQIGSEGDVGGAAWRRDESGTVPLAERQPYKANQQEKDEKEEQSSGSSQKRRRRSSRWFSARRSSPMGLLSKPSGTGFFRLLLAVSLIAAALSMFFAVADAFLKCLAGVRAPSQSGAGSSPRRLAVSWDFDECIELLSDEESPSAEHHRSPQGDDAASEVSYYIDDDDDDDQRGILSRTLKKPVALVLKSPVAAFIIGFLSIGVVAYWVVMLTIDRPETDYFPSDEDTGFIPSVNETTSIAPFLSSTASMSATSASDATAPGSISPSAGGSVSVSPRAKGTEGQPSSYPATQNGTADVVIGQVDGGVPIVNTTIWNKTYHVYLPRRTEENLRKAGKLQELVQELSVPPRQNGTKLEWGQKGPSSTMYETWDIDNRDYTVHLPNKLTDYRGAERHDWDEVQRVLGEFVVAVAKGRKGNSL